MYGRELASLFFLGATVFSACTDLPSARIADEIDIDNEANVQQLCANCIIPLPDVQREVADNLLKERSVVLLNSGDLNSLGILKVPKTSQLTRLEVNRLTEVIETSQRATKEIPEDAKAFSVRRLHSAQARKRYLEALPYQLSPYLTMVKRCSSISNEFSVWVDRRDGRAVLQQSCTGGSEAKIFLEPAIILSEQPISSLRSDIDIAQ